MCLIPLPEEPSESEVAEKDEDTCSCHELKACMRVVDDDEEPCVCSDEDLEKEKIECEPEVVCQAVRSFDDYDKSDDCSCPSLGCREDIAEPVVCPAVEVKEEKPVEAEVPKEDVVSEYSSKKVSILVRFFCC